MTADNMLCSHRGLNLSRAGPRMLECLERVPWHLLYEVLRDALHASRGPVAVTCRCLHSQDSSGECSSLEQLLREQLAKPQGSATPLSGAGAGAALRLQGTGGLPDLLRYRPLAGRAARVPGPDPGLRLRGG